MAKGIYTKEEVDKMLRPLQDEIKKMREEIDLSSRRSDIDYMNIEEKRYGLQVNGKMVIPRKNITASGSCPTIGEIAQRTNTDSDLYICNQNNTWEKVGAQ